MLSIAIIFFACFISLWMTRVVLPVFVFPRAVSAKWKSKYGMLVQDGTLTTLLNNKNGTNVEKEEDY